MKNRVYATERIKALRTPAKLSEFINSLDTLKPGTLVVLYVRASTRSQRENLPDQITKLKAEMEKRGLLIIAILQEIVSGWEQTTSGRVGRFGFERAILKAKDSGAVVVAESVNRFLRIRRYRSRRFQPPSVFDMKRVMSEADGVPLATVVHPDALPDDERSYQTKRGQTGKGNYGGRPKEKHPKKVRRLRLLPEAIALWETGKSYRQIGTLLKVPWSTIRDWTKTQKTAHPQVQANP